MMTNNHENKSNEAITTFRKTTPGKNPSLDILKVFDFINKLVIFLAPIMTKTIDAIEKIKENSPAILESIKILNDTHSARMELIKKLAQKGWFVSGSLYYKEIVEFLDDVIKNSEDTDFKVVDHKAKSFINTNFDNLVKILIKNNPIRAHILNDAIYAHKTGKYNLSTPVFISQADGISKEKTGVNLFHAFDFKKFENAVKYYETKEDANLLMACLSFLQCYFVFTEESKKGSDLFLSEKGKNNLRPDDFNGLNRHQIMHGEVVDYGTEINSLKAFTFLSAIDALICDN